MADARPAVQDAPSGSERPADGPARLDVAPAADAAPPLVGEINGIDSASVSGFQLLVRRRNADGTIAAAAPFDIRGISWSPAEMGGGQPDLATHVREADRDLPLMHAANMNVVKTYAAVSRELLDKIQANGLLAIVTVVPLATSEFESVVTTLRDHPALLMWVIGNEWNLNRFYNTCAIDECFNRVITAAQRIKALDPKHPVSTSFAAVGTSPTDAELMRLSGVDVWALNIYSQPGFFNRFTDWRLQATRTGVQRPFFISEYGADAYNTTAGRADAVAQATALRTQTQEIRQQLSARNPAFPCLGGTPFEFNDEWWKRGAATVQDPGGFANVGVAPDQFANEDWWGLVDINRTPRDAYQAIKLLYGQ
jgi:hypothetical protein